jgi:15-hydroxyprostaglandin dehydrogenase (NAD)
MKSPLVALLIPITPDKYETPMNTIMRAFNELLPSNKSGQVVETSGPNIYYRNQQAYPNEITNLVWDNGPTFLGWEMANFDSD